MKKKKKLTIGIPTFNRPENLKILLNRLRDCDQSLFNIIISDDSTDHGVRDVIDQYRCHFTNLSYFRNSTPSFSKNVVSIYQKANSDYLWYVCDDDVPEFDCVSQVLGEIEKSSNSSVVILNCSWVDPLGRSRIAVAKPNLVRAGDKSAFLKCFPRTTFLSLCVFKTGLVVDNFFSKDGFKNNIFTQVTIASELLGDNGTIYESSYIALERKVGFKYGDFLKFSFTDLLDSVEYSDVHYHSTVVWQFLNGQFFTNLMLYASTRVGLFTYEAKWKNETRSKFIKKFGLKANAFLLAMKIIDFLPKVTFKASYFAVLCWLYGPVKGRKLLNQEMHRSARDNRKTDFTAY